MRRKGSRKTAIIYMAPAMIVILIFLYLPIILNFMNSLYKWGAMTTEVSYVGFKYYKELLQDETIRIAIKNNLVFAVMSVACQIGLSLVVAAVLESKFLRRWQSVFRTIYFIPSLLMVTVTGITFKMLYSPSIGLINPLLEAIGIGTSNIDILGNAKSAIFGVAAASQWQYIGYTVVLFIVAMQSISDDIYEAAEIDGATRWKQTLHVTLPGISSTIIIMLILRIGSIMAVGYEKTILLYNPQIHETADIIASFVYRKGLEEFNYGYSTAVSLFNSVINFILLVTTNTISKKYSETSLF